MTPEDLYDDLAIQFPPLWPQSPEWSWVNVHDGQKPRIEVLSELLARAFASAEVIVLVRSTPGIAIRMPRVAAAEYAAQFLLLHEVQIANPELDRFVSVASNGAATSDA
jgi:hypothetical protein